MKLKATVLGVRGLWLDCYRVLRDTEWATENRFPECSSRVARNDFPRQRSLKRRKRSNNLRARGVVNQQSNKVFRDGCDGVDRLIDLVTYSSWHTHFVGGVWEVNDNTRVVVGFVSFGLVVGDYFGAIPKAHQLQRQRKCFRLATESRLLEAETKRSGKVSCRLLMKIDSVSGQSTRVNFV